MVTPLPLAPSPLVGGIFRHEHSATQVAHPCVAFREMIEKGTLSNVAYATLRLNLKLSCKGKA